MFLLHGKRSLIIKKYSDHTHACPHCRGLNLEVKVEKFYYHLFYIPFFPTHEKFAHIRCGNCGQPYKDPALEEDSYEELEDEYEKKTRNPVYLYSGLLLISSLIIFIVVAKLRVQQREAAYITQPLTGDTYLIREKRDNKKIFYFLRVSRISGDSVFTQHGHKEYTRFTRTISKEDYFLREDRGFHKEDLVKMLKDDIIKAVKRDPDNKQ